MRDIFDFWAGCAPDAHVHPADAAVLGRVPHGFDLGCLPIPFTGPLRTAPVVLLFLSPGSADGEAAMSGSGAHRAWHGFQRTGWAPMPSEAEHPHAWAWWSKVVRQFGVEPGDVRDRFAVLNIGAYHSKAFKDWHMPAALPSSRATLDWAQGVLFPQAERGERVVVCLRSARLWGLGKGTHTGVSLHAPRHTRSGIMLAGEPEDGVRSAVRQACGLGPAARARPSRSGGAPAPTRPVPGLGADDDGKAGVPSARDPGGTDVRPASRAPEAPLAPLLAAAVEAAREAGDMLRAEFHREGGIRGAGSHADVDAEVEAMLKARLLAALPCGWLGEETARVTGRDPRTWVVDPNDGTVSYLQRRRGSSVSIALVDDGRPVLGVVHAFGYPDEEGDLVDWAEGCGPVRRNGVAVGRRLDGLALSRDGVVAVSQAAGDSPGAAAANAALVAPARFLSIPSVAYRLALAACGEAVAGCSLSPVSAWDVAGGHALLVGAGGTLLDGKGKPVTYGARADADIHGCFGGAPAAAKALAGRDWTGALRSAGPVGPTMPRRPSLPGLRVNGQGMLSRAQGCLVGQLAGDSLGSLVEFKGRAEIRALYPDGLRLLADGGTWDTVAGQPTDDGEMALALARSIVAKGGYDAHAAFSAYKAWAASDPFDMGGTTGKALAQPFERAGCATGDSQANGSLMRVSPIGVAQAGRPAAAAGLAGRDSALTHPNPVCVAACRAYAAAIATGVGGGGRPAMLSAASEHAGEGEGAATIRRTLERAREAPPADHATNMGWVLVALQEAFHRLASGMPAAEAVTASVMEGGDTDTNGAITGALLGAADGLGAFPTQWRSVVITCRPMRASGAPRPRPATYWPDDALDLAEALLATTTLA